ncbi:glycoside hydrolase family 16 protein [Algoriphagus sp. NG3]|uniref:glycoside hydrolase family 16 protein n=1 Tax=Algoriphagus sp. NG3 TaxID=3097546 RepID=UPI002A7F8E78|nr:glycoside hydrolase family 16 protein [Algoriphagus sp. NG3]WPR75937.1 glycoside hydrolase family 16 protein [Algoriphagus sp. NG3]
MLTKLYHTFLFLAMVSLTSSCNQEEVDQQVMLPENLEMNVELGENGVANLSYAADKANFYRVSFGANNQPPELVQGLQASYRYSLAGEYTITVQAHATESEFIKKEEKVLITEQLLGIGLPTSGFESPLEYEGYELAWNDEFEEGTLSPDWVFELGDGCPNLCGWGNNELQYYRRENTELKDGYLVITAKEESIGGKNYTSSRLKTQGKQVFQFGRIDIRAALPKGQGIWPALWMLGENIPEVNWPACGEIDIMEMIGGDASGRDDTIHGTLHWDNNGNYAYHGGSKSLSAGAKFSDNFHVYSIIWDENKITWLLDNEVFHEMDISPTAMDEFRKPFFLLINLAVGGNWPGNPDNTTVFPQQLAVDYVRVFEKE